MCVTLVLGARTVRAASDWRVYCLVMIGVLTAAVLATIAPVLRGGSFDPISALRAE